MGWSIRKSPEGCQKGIKAGKFPVWRVEPCGSGVERSLLERNGLKRNGVERSLLRRNGLERNGVERSLLRRNGLERGGVENRKETDMGKNENRSMEQTAEQTMEQSGYLYVDEKTLKKVDEKMPPEEELQDLGDFFKIFGDATRLKILYVLLCTEMCVLDIAKILDMSQSAISHQLRILKQMDLVKNRREGKTIFYSLADSHIVTILSQGLDHIEE